MYTFPKSTNYQHRQCVFTKGVAILYHAQNIKLLNKCEDRQTCLCGWQLNFWSRAEYNNNQCTRRHTGARIPAIYIAVNNTAKYIPKTSTAPEGFYRTIYSLNIHRYICWWAEQGTLQISQFLCASYHANSEQIQMRKCPHRISWWQTESNARYYIICVGVCVVRLDLLFTFILCIRNISLLHTPTHTKASSSHFIIIPTLHWTA